MDWNLGQQQDTGHTALDKYETDSDNESDEEDDFEVVYGRTCMTDQVGKISTRSWLVRLYPEADVILMVIRLNLIYTYSKNRLIGVLIAIAYPFLVLRLHNYVLFYIFSYV